MSTSKSPKGNSNGKSPDQWNEKFQDVLVQITELQGALTRQFSIAQRHSQELREQKEANHTLSANLEDRQRRVADLEAENSRLNSLIEDTQKRSRRFQELGKEVSSKLEEKEQKLLELQSQLEHLTAQSSAKIQSLQASKEELLAEVARTRGDLDTQNNARTQVIRERVHVEYSDQLQRMQKQLKQAYGRVQQLESEKALHEKACHEDSRSMESLRKELAETRDRLTELNSQSSARIAELKTQLHQLRLSSETGSAENQRKIKLLALELEESQERIRELQEQLRHRQSEIERLRKLNQVLNEKVIDQAGEALDSIVASHSKGDTIYSSPAPSQDQ